VAVSRLEPFRHTYSNLSKQVGFDLEQAVREKKCIVADLVQDDTADALVLAQALVNMLQQVSVRTWSALYP
jgi:hypothetical protein